MTNEKQNMTRVERRNATTKRRIISAALACFEEYGYPKTTINHIASKADIGYGTFYQYFENKTELLGELADELSERVDSYFSPSNKKLSFKENIEYGIQGVIKCYLSNRVVFIAMQEAVVSGEALEDKWERIHDILFKRIQREVERFINKRECRPVDVEITSRAITMMLDGYAQFLMTQPKGTIDIPNISEGLSDLCFHMLMEPKLI